MTDFIQSASNPRIQHVSKLQANSRLRKQEGLFVIEGIREIERAAAAGCPIVEIFYCPEIVGSAQDNTQIESLPAGKLVQISRQVFEKLAYRETTGGIMAVAKQNLLSTGDLKLSKLPVILVLESVEKPGNLGAILRTADGAGVEAVIICDPLSDIYNPNVIRASLGCVFSTQVVVCDSSEAIALLHKQQIRIFAAALTAEALPYYKFDYSGATAFVMGTEATGLSKFWLENSDHQIIIPMNGIADSLNVSTSAAILVYEAFRQRQP